MGTRGFIVYRFRGRYYVFYNHWDSYPQGLGKKLVQDIRFEDPVAFQTWLQDRRAEYADLDTYFGIPPEDARNFELVSTSGLTAPHMKVFGLDRRLLQMVPTIFPPCNDLFIEWIYTFDLDSCVFSVNNNRHFALGTVPPNWMESVPGSRYYKPKKTSLKTKANDDTDTHDDTVEHSEDDTDYECSHISKQTHFDLGIGSLDNHCISLRQPPPTPNPQYVQLWKSMQRKLIKPKTLAHLLPGKLAAVLSSKKLCERWIKSMPSYEFLWPQWTNDNKVFRELAHAIALFAAGMPDHLVFGTNPQQGNQYVFETRDVYTEEPQVAFKICSPFHIQGFSPWICPESSIFWVGNILVYPMLFMEPPNETEQGAYSARLGEAIARLVEVGQSTGHVCFTGVLLSLETCLLVKRFPDGRIEFTNALDLFPNDAEEQINGFAALAFAFEAEAVAELRLSRHAESGRLPLEILYNIIDHSDFSTWSQLMKVSHTFRKYCHSQPWRVDDIEVKPGKENGFVNWVTNVRKTPILGSEYGRKVAVTGNWEDDCY